MQSKITTKNIRLMYGKIFSTMYEGSMVGAGATVFAVMGYVISKQRPPEFNVELNSKLLSAVIGEPEERIISAIEYLCSPDSGSRSDKEQGRRLTKIGAFTYHVVNGADYDKIRNYEERKAYNREKQAEYRLKNGAQLVDDLETSEPTRFRKPFLQELINYAREIKFNDFNPQKFLDHYEANGWKRGKTQIKDWKACVRTWHGSANQSQSKEGFDISDAELLRQSQQ
jgi:hypothetical protein